MSSLTEAATRLWTQEYAGTATATQQAAGRAGLDAADGPVKRSKALRRWFSQLVDRENVRVDMVCVGNSITEGYNTLTSTRWIGKLQDRLRARYPVSGIIGGAGYYSVIRAIATPADWPVTVVGGNPNGLIDGLGIKCLSMGTSTPATVTFACPAATSVELRYYTNPGSGTFQYTVDGGAPVTVNCFNGSVSGFQKTTITGLGGTTHTIVVSNLSGSTIFDGFMVYNGDETVGVHVWESGRSSVTAETLNGNTTWFDAFNKIQPSLVVIELGANDALGKNPPNSPAFYRTQMDGIIAKIRAKCTVSPSIVIIPVWNISPGGGITPVAPWSDYVAQMYDIAANDDLICILDMQKRFNTGSPSTSDGLLPDSTHPGRAGSIMFADILYDFITPRT